MASVNVTQVSVNETPADSLPSRLRSASSGDYGAVSGDMPRNDSGSISDKSFTPAVRETLNPNSKSDVSKRFQDVVLGNEAQYLNRWENTHVKLDIAGEYTPEDVRTMTGFVLRFNNESETTKLSMPCESGSEEFTVRFVPSSFFATIDENKANKVIRNPETGEVLFVDRTDPYT